MKNELVFEEESFVIRGAIYEVYKNLGAGFLESIYQEALEIELCNHGIPFESQKDITVSYKGYPMRQQFRADMVCYGQIILELKAVSKLLPEHEAQLHNYLKAMGLHLGFLVNFSSPHGVEIKRIVR